LAADEPVRVERDGVVLADAGSSVMVFETGLPTRYYLDRTAVNVGLLSSSATVTACPYKGTTSAYWSFRDGGTVLDDIAWPAKARPEMSHGVAFFNHFRDLTASGFFSSEMGWKDVRYVGNTFNPTWNGCPPEAMAKLGVSQDVMKTRVRVE